MTAFLYCIVALATGDTSRIADRITALRYYGVFDHISFRLDGAALTLTGQVTWPALRDDAERSVRAIEGVGRVINRIEVLPLSPQDDRLRLAEFRAIYGDPVLDSYARHAVPPIRIVVENGSVTLEGAVASEADKNLAGTRAGSPPEALSVTNNLVVNLPRAAQTPTRVPRSFVSQGIAASTPTRP